MRKPIFVFGGWMVVNFLALVYYYRLYRKLQGFELIEKYTPMGIILYFQQPRKTKVMSLS